MILSAAPTGEAAKAGPWWLAVVLLLCIASYFLFRSMSKHLRKVRDEFPVELVDPPAGPTAPPAEGQADLPATPEPERDAEQHDAQA